ncbi:ATP-binding cassette domain-containing protein [Alloiococcus sp. CFN-8]|uniref:ATP-binding cassette domain-containing protein n=1 Tax=Alloiococcus sp. CFN-8 TaxID=3416081 RepID=UPI003CFB37EE
MNIVFKDIYKAYKDKTVLKDCNLTFPEGKVTCLMGPSGCGKTTILRLIMGLDMADKGIIQGREGKRLSAVFQEDRLCESFTAIGNILAVAPKNISRENIIDHLKEIGLRDCFYKPVSELSGGMKRRVAIARAILSSSDLILLDEPFKGLDKENLKLTAAYVKKYTQDATVIMVSHSLEEAELLEADMIIDLNS